MAATPGYDGAEQAMNGISFLSGQFLLAMPGIGDPRFEQSVIAVCAHDPNGAFGLCLHRAIDGLTVPELMRQMEVDPGATPARPVLLGGPVETERGFVLHSPDWAGQDTRHTAMRWAVTGTTDVLRAIAEGRGPRQWLVALGYAGWGAGQLDEEMQRHGWFATAGDDLLFDVEAGQRWARAFALAGIDSRMLSTGPGHA